MVERDGVEPYLNLDPLTRYAQASIRLYDAQREARQAERDLLRWYDETVDWLDEQAQAEGIIRLRRDLEPIVRGWMADPERAVRDWRGAQKRPMAYSTFCNPLPTRSRRRASRWPATSRRSTCASCCPSPRSSRLVVKTAIGAPAAMPTGARSARPGSCWTRSRPSSPPTRNHLPLTVRQVFYRLVATYGFEKTERAYGRLCEHLVRARRAKLIPFGVIRDDGPVSYSSEWHDGPEAFWDETVERIREYRRDRQAGQRVRVEL